MQFVPIEFRRNYPFDPALYFNFEKFQNLPEGTFICSITDLDYIKSIKGKKYYLQLEEPNGFLWPNFFEHQNLFDKTFSICQYTNDYFHRNVSGKGEYVFFPTNFDLIPKYRKDKDIDFIYSGTIYSSEISKLLRSLKNFNLCVISQSNDPVVTHRNISYIEKLELYSRAKFSIVHNQLFFDHSSIKQLKNNFPDFANHGAFSEVQVDKFVFRNKNRITRVPQLKSRLFESTANGCIPVVISDKWNLVNNWFEPNEYIQATEADLPNIARVSLNIYKQYIDLGFFLSDKTKKHYSTESFVKKYIEPIGER